MSRASVVALMAAASLPLRADAQNQYVGVRACAACHESQFQAWEKSKHAGAVRTLAKMDAAGEARQVEGLWIVRMGRGDKYGLPVPAAEFPHCLVCHATAANADPRIVSSSLDRKAGVQCESCHGPASAHAMVETWKRSGKPIPAAEVAAALEVAGAVTLKRYASERDIEALCTKCHDGMCGDFDFQKTRPKVRHSNPGKAEPGQPPAKQPGR